jgi:hypothetical protein
LPSKGHKFERVFDKTGYSCSRNQPWAEWSTAPVNRVDIRKNVDCRSVSHGVIGPIAVAGASCSGALDTAGNFAAIPGDRSTMYGSSTEFRQGIGTKLLEQGFGVNAVDFQTGNMKCE